jgi:hypothetical protein
MNQILKTSIWPHCAAVSYRKNEYSAGRKNVMTWKKIDHGNKFVACSMEARAGAL